MYYIPVSVCKYYADVLETANNDMLYMYLDAL